MKSRRYGFIEFKDQEPVQKLLSIENLLFRNKKVIVSSFIANKLEMDNQRKTLNGSYGDFSHPGGYGPYNEYPAYPNQTFQRIQQNEYSN